MVFASNKAGAESYAFGDDADSDGVTYYQLKIVNKNKIIASSTVIALKRGTAKGVSSLSILKNPVEATLTFTYTSAAVAPTNVVIYSASGVKVFSTKINSQKGTNAVSLNLDSRIVSGTYILEVSTAKERSMAKLIKR